MNEDIIEQEPAPDFSQLEADAAELDGVEHASVAMTETLQSKTLVKTALSPLFTVIAPNWNVSEQEIDALSESYGALLDKYCPSGYEKYSVEIAAIVVTASVIAPRAGTPRKFIKADKPESTPSELPHEETQTSSDKDSTLTKAG